MNVLFRLGAWTTLLVLRATKRWRWRQSSMRWAREGWRDGTKCKKRLEPINQNNAEKPGQKDEVENMEHNINLRTILMPSLQQVDLKPVCKKCYDRYPREMRLRLKKWEKNNVFFLQDYSFQIYDYLQVSRGRSNSGPTRWVSLVEVDSPTNRLPNHRSTQWRS